MARPKGNKNGNKVANTKQAPKKASTPSTSKRNSKTGPSVSTSSKRVLNTRKKSHGQTRVASSNTDHTITFSKPRVKKYLPKAPEIVFIGQPDEADLRGDLWILGAGAAACFVLGLVIGVAI